MRATQIGIVSRGRGCADYNAPAIFGSVIKIMDFIEDILSKEMNSSVICPKSEQSIE